MRASSVGDPRGGSIAYILARFPLLSESFILNEILGLEQLGLDILVFAFHGAGHGVTPEKASLLRAPVVYLPERWYVRLPLAAWANAAAFIRSPMRYARAVVSCASHLSTLRAFLGAVLWAKPLRSSRPRILYAHFISSPAGVARALSILLGIPYGVTVHAEDLFLTPPRVMCPRAVGASLLVTVSNYNRDLIRSRCTPLEPGAISVVHCGVTVAPEVPARPPIREMPSVLSVGRLVPIKGHGTLIEALRLLARRDVPFRCRIVGGGQLEGALLEKVREAGLDATVEITGPRDHHEVEALLAQSDVFVLSCARDDDGNMDGIPVALMEAMAHGLPVVSTTVSGVPELVTADTGILVPPKNPEQLAEALGTLLGDKELRVRMGEAGRARVSREFSSADQARQMYRLLTGQVPPQ